MKPVVVLENESEAPAGYLGDALDRRGIPWVVVRMYAGESPPEVDMISAAVALGGAMGAYEEEEYPFLVDQKRYLAECTAAGVPVLGICLGCQLLADALGGRAYLADEREVLIAPIEATSEGEGDPVIAALAGRSVVRFHKDTFDVPPGVEVLATGGGFAQAFRFGSALGIQPHPEVTPTLLSGWLARGSGREAAIAAGTDPDALIVEYANADAESAATAAAVFDAWLDEVVDR